MQDDETAPVNSPPHRGWIESSLIWLGWTLAYAGFCVGTYLGIDRLIGRTTWWVIPLLLLWAAAAFAIGYVYKNRAWVAGPAVIGFAPPIAMIALSIFYSMQSHDYLDGYGFLIFLVAVFTITGPMLLMSLIGAAGVYFGKRHAQGPRSATDTAPVADAILLQHDLPPTSRHWRNPGSLAGEFAAGPVAPASRNLVEDILSTPMPRDLGHPPARP